MKLFDIGNEYLRQSDWKTLALVKFCLCSIGIIIGLLLPEAMKKTALIIAVLVFILTYIPLMTKLYKIYKEMK